VAIDEALIRAPVPPAPSALLWAACLYNHPLLVRAECLQAAGFEAMSVFAGDVEQEVRRLGSLAALRSELRSRSAHIACLDVYLGWHPSFDPAPLPGPTAGFMSATEQQMLAIASELEIDTISVAAPFGGRIARRAEVIDGLGAFTERAAACGSRVGLEISAGSQVGDLDIATALLDGVGHRGLGLILDTYNLARAKIAPDDLAALPAGSVSLIQLVDAAAEPVAERFEESLHHRQLPGNGELPLLAYLAAMARLGPLPMTGPEIFNDALTRMPSVAAAQACAAATSALLAQLPDAAGFDSDQR
jgi:sugar phosphate isomerase/epimerase